MAALCQAQGVPAALWGAGLSPWRAVLIAARPDLRHGGVLPWFGSPRNLFLTVATVVTVAANAVAIWRVRIWNPSRESQFQPLEEVSKTEVAHSYVNAWEKKCIVRRLIAGLMYKYKDFLL